MLYAVIDKFSNSVVSMRWYWYLLLIAVGIPVNVTCHRGLILISSPQEYIIYFLNYQVNNMKRTSKGPFDVRFILCENQIYCPYMPCYLPVQPKTGTWFCNKQVSFGFLWGHFGSLWVNCQSKCKFARVNATWDRQIKTKDVKWRLRWPKTQHEGGKKGKKDVKIKKKHAENRAIHLVRSICQSKCNHHWELWSCAPEKINTGIIWEW